MLEIKDPLLGGPIMRIIAFRSLYIGVTPFMETPTSEHNSRVMPKPEGGPV